MDLDFRFLWMRFPPDQYSEMSHHRSFLCGLLVLVNGWATAQNEYSITNGSIHSCAGVLYDSGGPGGPGYGNNESFTFTICPDQPGNVITLQFTEVLLNQVGGASTMDRLDIYDGADVEATLIGSYTGTGLQDSVVGASLQNTGGCLTLSFHSNNAGTGYFAAEISCHVPCERPTAAYTMDPYPARICAGEEVQFDAGASQAAPGQSIATYEWHFGPNDVEITTDPFIARVFNGPGGYSITMVAVDDLGCGSVSDDQRFVQVSTAPEFTYTTTDTVACVGSPFELHAVIDPMPWSEASVDYGPGIYIPDGTITPVTSSIELTGFAPGASLPSTDDILSICVDMEHSYMGDLILRVTCPDGSEVVLHQQGGASTFLGSPIDTEEIVPGECWHYCWSPTATNGTWVDNSLSGLNTTQPVGDPPRSSLVPDTYEAIGSWDELVGCPLNGIWSFNARDALWQDNGFICSWELHFDPALGGDDFAFTPTYGAGCDSTYWSGADITGSDVDCNGVVITPSAPGEQPYTFTTTNDFGCTFDSTIVITVLPATDLYCITLGVDAPASEAVSVRPMPVHDILQVSHREPIIGYELLDLRGRELMSGRVAAAYGTVQVDVSALPAGLYFLRVEGPSGTVPVRVVKE